MNIYKIEFYVPVQHLEITKNALFEAGAGRIGNYDCCCWCTEGTGQFRPCSGSNPYIGEKDKIESLTEIKVELVCEEQYLEPAIANLLKSHPYETPAYQFWPINTTIEN